MTRRLDALLLHVFGRRSVALSILNRDLSGALQQAAVSYCGVVYNVEDTTDRWLIYSWITYCTGVAWSVFFCLFFLDFFLSFCVLHHKGIALSIFSTIWVWRIERVAVQQHRCIKWYKWHLHNDIPLILPPERRCRPHLFFLPGLLLPCCPYLRRRLAVSFSGDTLHWCESMDHRLEHWYAANIRQLRRDTPSYPHAVPPILSMYPLSSGALSIMQESTSRTIPSCMYWLYFYMQRKSKRLHWD